MYRVKGLGILKYSCRPRRYMDEDERRIKWIRDHWNVPPDWSIEPVELEYKHSILEHVYIGYKIVDQNGKTVWYAILRPVDY